MRYTIYLDEADLKRILGKEFPAQTGIRFVAEPGRDLHDRPSGTYRISAEVTTQKDQS